MGICNFSVKDSIYRLSKGKLRAESVMSRERVNSIDEREFCKP